jgi:hypothetical protein
MRVNISSAPSTRTCIHTRPSRLPLPLPLPLRGGRGRHLLRATCPRVALRSRGRGRFVCRPQDRSTRGSIPAPRWGLFKALAGSIKSLRGLFKALAGLCDPRRSGTREPSGRQAESGGLLVAFCDAVGVIRERLAGVRGRLGGICGLLVGLPLRWGGLRGKFAGKQSWCASWPMVFP